MRGDMYRILIDYRSEGWQFLSTKDTIDEYGSVEAAVKGFLSSHANMNPFLVVQVVDWEAKEKPQP